MIAVIALVVALAAFALSVWAGMRVALVLREWRISNENAEADRQRRSAEARRRTAVAKARKLPR